MFGIVFYFIFGNTGSPGGLWSTTPNMVNPSLFFVGSAMSNAEL